MVRIRFRRVGARNQPSYRIVAADKDSPRDGRFLEVIGSYNPRTNPSTLQVDEARLFHWMSHGAQPSDSVVQTLQSVGTWDRWERFKGGESIEGLVQEAEAAIPKADPRTRRDDLIGQRSTKRRRHADAEPKAEAEVKAETVEAAAEEPVEDETAESAEAEVDESAEAEAEGGAEAVEDEGAAAETEEQAEAEAEEDSQEDEAAVEAEESAEAEAAEDTPEDEAAVEAEDAEESSEEE
jgi:small subunit ribosomal protein S16